MDVLCQAGIPLGIMVGYGVSGAMRSQGLSWKVPFFQVGRFTIWFSVVYGADRILRC